LSSNNALLAKANGFSLHAGVLFFPAAAVHAELLLPLSVSGRVGRLSLVLAANARELHAGEMVFGFATAVIAVMGATILLQVAGGRWQVAGGRRRPCRCHDAKNAGVRVRNNARPAVAVPGFQRVSRARSYTHRSRPAVMEGPM